MSIGTRIREARKNVKMTQAELAKKVGMSQSALSELETGESDGTTLLGSFASALGVNALWLETGKGLAEPSNGQAPPRKDREARMILAYEDEEDLLDHYRRASPRDRFEILKLATRAANRAAKE